jgi:hypothetical protein
MKLQAAMGIISGPPSWSIWINRLVGLAVLADATPSCAETLAVVRASTTQLVAQRADHVATRDSLSIPHPLSGSRERGL